MSPRRCLELVIIFLIFLPKLSVFAEDVSVASGPTRGHEYNGIYQGANLTRIAFPIGGIGAGMFCLEGGGTVSHLSLRGSLDFFREPCSFAAISIRSADGRIAKVLEGPVRDWKVFGASGTGNGGAGKSYGLPRFEQATFLARFPFAEVGLADTEIPLDIKISGWSPFIPGNEDDSSLPVGSLEYSFENTSDEPLEFVFSYHTKNFMTMGRRGDTILPIKNGFILHQSGSTAHPEHEGSCAIFTNNDKTVVDHCWFRGSWWDGLTLAWRNIKQGRLLDNPPQAGKCPGASLYTPVVLKPHERKTICLMFAWYVPNTRIRLGWDPVQSAFSAGPSRGTGLRQQEVTGFVGQGLVNTFDPNGDEPTGTLTSPPFRLTANYIQFLIGGANDPEKTCMQLLVDDEVVRISTGKRKEQLEWTTWDIKEFRGREARIRIVDLKSEGWGHINVDHIVMTRYRWDSVEDMMKSESRRRRPVTVIADFEGEDYGDWEVGSTGGGCNGTTCGGSEYHVPWYAGKYKSVVEVADFWRANYERLRSASGLFRDTFYDTTLPPEVIEAVSANLTILKSPTVLRQVDGKLWCFEGCSDNRGCCHGSCTHVWNYAQAICHLFPNLERSLRDTEFTVNQDDKGHQAFRASLPIRTPHHKRPAAADGQLGGIIKVHRDWRISGDTDWLRGLWPAVQKSLDYCIRTWDPRGRGLLEEPHHNTYDIEYWGPNGHCTSVYLAALTAAVEMGEFLEDDVADYRTLLEAGCRNLENELFNGEYFYQKVQITGLNAEYKPLDFRHNGEGYWQIIDRLNSQGPRYQYGNGCLSDGVFGFWLARACGLDREIVDTIRVKSNLLSIHRYNLRRNLSDHANPQRPTFALGSDGGLLLCTWPKGNAPDLPFVYSDEVWTGIEYQVASHLMMNGLIDQGLEIVRICRDRYDGRKRNPFDEYECGHWYGRALASYVLLQGMTGVRYDAIDKTLYMNNRLGTDFRCFLSTAGGFGTVGLRGGKPFYEVKSGTIDVEKTVVTEDSGE